MNSSAGAKPVIAALVGNTFVFTIKCVAAVVSGSSALFSEAVHSFADTANQLLLYVGLRRSQKKADEDFAYGYGNERFFWALLSACSIFFIGAGVTIYEGILTLTEHAEVSFKPIIFLILLISGAVEVYTFIVAARELKRQFPGTTLWERLRDGDPATLAVYLEDGVAVLGLLVACASITLTYLTKNVMWDAIGSILIGICLGTVAVILILKNKAFLIGQTIEEALKEALIAELEADPAIEKVIDFKSTVLDIGKCRIKCEVEFNGHAVLKEAYKNPTLEEQHAVLKEDYEEFIKFCVDFSDRVPRLMGRRIDDIEKRLKAKYPQVRHIDIEIN